MIACHRSSGLNIKGRWLSKAANTVEIRPSSTLTPVLPSAEERMIGSEVMIESIGSVFD